MSNQQSSKKQMLTFKMCIQPTYDQMAIILDLKKSKTICDIKT